MGDGFSRPLIRETAEGLGYPDFHIPGLGFVLTFIILWIVGGLAANVVGRRLLHNAREALEGLPLVRTIYAPVRQLMESMTSPEKAGFERVVLVEYPRTGLWALGFLAGDVPRAEEEITGAQHFRAHHAQSHHRLYAERAPRAVAPHRSGCRGGAEDDRLRRGGGAALAGVARRGWLLGLAHLDLAIVRLSRIILAETQGGAIASNKWVKQGV